MYSPENVRKYIIWFYHVNILHKTKKNVLRLSQEDFKVFHFFAILKSV